MTEIYETTYEIFLVREIFNICLIIALMIFAGYLLVKMREKEPESAQRNIYLGYTLFLVSYALTRVFFIFSDFEVFNTMSSETALNNIYVGIAYSFGIFGALCLVLMIERYLIRTRYIFTIFAAGIFVLSIISIFSLIPTEIPQLIITIAFPVFFGIIVLLYLYVAIKSSGDARKRSFGIVAGLFIMMIGFLFGSSLIGQVLDPMNLYEIRILIEPFIIIMGGAVFTFSQR